MSAAAAAAEATPAPAPKRSKKLLVIILAAVLLLAALGGGGFMWWKKKKQAAEEAEDGGEHAKVEQTHSGPPTWLPLEPFVVNLADRDADRYAQVGVTLEVEDAKAADQVRAWMPAVRNAILLALASKTTKDLLDRNGKEQLADEILREAARAMGIPVATPKPVTIKVADKVDVKADAKSLEAGKGEGGAEAKADKADHDEAKAEKKPAKHDADDEDDPAPAKSKKKSEKADKAEKAEKPATPPVKNPVVKVHFSSFIIQ